MAKRSAPLMPMSITAHGLNREQLWQTVEGLHGIGIYESIIRTPPPLPPELEMPIAANGTRLIAAPKQRDGKTAKEMILRLAQKGEPFAFIDAKATMRKGGRAGGPGAILKAFVEDGTLKKIGRGEYIIASVEPDKTVATNQSVIGMVEQMLKDAHPKPILAADVTARMVAAGKRPSTGSVAIAALRDRKLTKRVGVGKWLYTPKGVKK